MHTSSYRHYQLLVKYHHSLIGALQVMENLLRNLRYQMFTLVAADNAVRAVGATKLLEEYFDSSNFGVCCELCSGIYISA